MSPSVSSMSEKSAATAPSSEWSEAMTAIEQGLLRVPGMARLRGDHREAAAADILHRLAAAGFLAGIPELSAAPLAAAA